MRTKTSTGSPVVLNTSTSGQYKYRACIGEPNNNCCEESAVVTVAEVNGVTPGTDYENVYTNVTFGSTTIPSGYGSLVEWSGGGTPATSSGQVSLCPAPPALCRPADLKRDQIVNFLDFAIFASAWRTTSGDPNYNKACDLEDNNAIDYNDLRVFCDDWLWQASWTQPFGAGLARSMGAGSGKAEGLQASPSQPAAQPNVDELIKWLEDLWSQDKQLQEMFTEQEWQESQEFLKLVQQ